ncbi:hypothetical protein EW146_g3181 [Bondarzewia mesenterica]|uniref:Uncharacterized protein n=1 Tax=Bondarzewia mesenterica TaxID=1095465 RepID=A0A4S4LYU2_9AGAM|nr:hypothetical protein EW146_g3181 [Bondarzewia mesenterica]
MSSFRNHRIIIASLFLPNTAILGESHPSTPEIAPIPSPSNPLFKQFKLTEAKLKMPRPSAPRAAVPLKSIVEDLKDKFRRRTVKYLPKVLAVNICSTMIRRHLRRRASRVQKTCTTPTSRIVSSEKNSRSAARRPHSDSPLGRQWHIEANPHCNGGLNNAVRSVEAKLKCKLWVGTLGTNTDSFKEPLKRSIDRRMMEEHESLPIWIPDEEFSAYYDMFCHQVLWPCLHYVVPDAPKTKYFYESSSFKQYVAVNQRFADAIVANYQDGDIIWVNDYHLMLLPSMVRAQLPNAVIGFFLHVAFPSSEIFRCLSVREALLHGVLSADLIGFQTTNYARHFRQTVSRILALETVPKGIQLEDRFVDVAVFPMGIDVKWLTEKKHEPEVAYWVQTLRERYSGLKIVVGRDKLDEIQGVRHKLLAFEAFLDKHPEFQQKVILIQVALQTTEENELHGGVGDVVARINSRFSTLTYQPVIFLHTEDLSFSQYLALLTIADAFLVTSMREGMAAHEFVECQEERHRPLILSEFTGSYSYSGFRSCIAVNPWDTRNTAKAIHQALTMDDKEAFSRWEDLHGHVVTQTAQAFVTSFLTRCLRTNIEHLQGDSQLVARFDFPRVLPRYKHSHRRLLLIDFEDTLWNRDPRDRTFNPPADALAVVGKLADDPKNEVWLLSGLPVKGALEEVAKTIPKVGLVAENGCFIKTLPGKNGEFSWINMVTNFNLTWKSACVEILNYFTERTPGSFVEEREASVVWRFSSGTSDNCPDHQWARRQAAEAQNHIFDSIGDRYGLRIIPGENSFLVLPNYISRSTAVGAILHPGGPAHSPLAGRAAWMAPDSLETENVSDTDFVLAVGSDEKLLRRLNELDNAETCSTGVKGTDAKWKLDKAEVVSVLKQFASISS